MTIGTVRIDQNRTDIGRVTVTSPVRTIVTDPKFRPKPNVAMNEIVDVNLENNRDGYTLVYNAVTEEFESSPFTDVAIGNINGGSF